MSTSERANHSLFAMEVCRCFPDNRHEQPVDAPPFVPMSSDKDTRLPLKPRKRRKMGARSVYTSLPAIALLVTNGCASLVNPSSDEVRDLVMAEIGKAGTPATKPAAFGAPTIVKKSQTSDAVIVAYELPAGQKTYLGEIVYRRSGFKYVPAQVTAAPRKSSITLDVPDAVRTVWKASNGAYRLFAHKDGPALSEFSQLSNRPFMLLIVDEQMKPIPFPVSGFGGPVDPAVRGMRGRDDG